MGIKGRVQSQAIKATLAALPAAVRERHGEAVRVTLSEMKRLARATVRVDTGTLQDHIDFSFSPTYASGKFGITAGTVVIRDDQRQSFKKVTRNDARVFRGQGWGVMRASHYAHLVEFGYGTVPAHPFMGPAFSSELSPLEERMRAAQRAVADDLTNIGSRYL